MGHPIQTTVRPALTVILVLAITPTPGALDGAPVVLETGRSVAALVGAAHPGAAAPLHPAGYGPWRVVIGMGAVWVANRADRTVSQLDPATNRVVGRPVALPFDPWDLAVGAGAVWVSSNGAAGAMARIDPRRHVVVALVGGEPHVLGPFIAAGADAVWTANGDERADGGTTVSRIDPATNRIVATFLAGENFQGIAVAAGSVWAASHDVGTVTRIDPRSNRVVATVKLGFAPHGLAARHGALWVIDYHGSAVWPINVATNHVGTPVQLDFAPFTGAVSTTGVWVTGPASSGRVVRVDPRNHRVAETLHVGGQPYAVAVGRGVLWVAVQDPDAVLRIVAH